MAGLKLHKWESKFSQDINSISLNEREKAGALLSVLPPHLQWDDFVTTIQEEWVTWQNDLSQYPACLIMLYAGLAFFEYDDATFWPQFAETVKHEVFSGNRQQRINKEFSLAAKNFHLLVKVRQNKSIDFVGTAVHYIGIPKSLWAGFLDICEWVIWRPEWRTLSQAEWEDSIVKRCGSKQRLKGFLSNNRDATTTLIQEVLDAREMLTKNLDVTLSDISHISILRSEYLEEIPETTEFLRPQDPDSLLQDRARLIFDETRCKIYIQLPSVDQEKLPATWSIDAHRQEAASTPDAFVLNSAVFCNRLVLSIAHNDEIQQQRIQGVKSWGIFDMENDGRWINNKREDFALKSYAIVSPSPIEIYRDGFEEEENPINEQFELSDGSTCYVTRLWPTGKRAEVRIKENGNETILHFRTRSRIRVHFLMGWGRNAGYFFYDKGVVGMDHLPVLCVTIPNGYFPNNEIALVKNFKVTIDDQEADGQWRRLKTESPDQEFWKWSWSRSPLIELRDVNVKLSSLAQLASAFKSVDLEGEHVFTVHAGPYIKEQLRIRIIYHSSEKLDACWTALPGSLLPLFLVSQSPSGLKWEELLLAKEVIAPRATLSLYLLYKYMKHKFVTKRGHRWVIFQSRAEGKIVHNKEYELKYCGNPSVIWGLYRHLCRPGYTITLPVIQVSDKRGELPYIRITWPIHIRQTIERYLKHQNVIFEKKLWIR